MFFRRKRKRPPGGLITVYMSVAFRLQSPQDIRARAVFLSIVGQVWTRHGVDTYEALPDDALRFLERCLVLVHRDLPRFDAVMEEAGTSQADLADLRREAVWDPECVVRVDEALARDDAEEEDRRARRVPLARADLVDWMAGQPRSVWHEVALGYNWDDDPVRDLGWIVRQPDCDLATAIVVFLRAAPDSYMTVRSVSDLPAGERCMFEMLDGLARRIAADDFRHRDYRVDPDDLRHWRGMTGRMREEGPLHRWDLPLDEIARLRGLPTNAPFTFHDGELYRAAVGA